MIFPINAEKSFDEMEDPFNLKPVRGEKKRNRGKLPQFNTKSPYKNTTANIIFNGERLNAFLLILGK